MKEYTLYIGLKQKDMVKENSLDHTIEVVRANFSKVGISGFNKIPITGEWGAVEEPSLMVSFINSFKVSETKFKEVVESIRDELNQEAILVSVKRVSFNFI